MNDEFRTMLSKSGHKTLSGADAVRLANRRLQESAMRAGSLNLSGVSLSVRHAHFGPGVYRQRQCAALHRHEQIHLEYVLSGRFDFAGGDQEESLPPGKGVALLPGKRHRWECRRTGFMFGGLLNLAGPRRDEFVQRLSRERPQAMCVFDGASAARIFKDLLFCLCDKGNTPWQTERTGFLLGLWLTEILASAWPLASWFRQDDRIEERETYLCRQAREFIVTNCTRQIRLDDIAAEVGVSARHLNRLYREHCGESLGQALVRLRLNEARRILLEERQTPVKAVAYRCGYSSPTYFTACYRRYFGQTPVESRA